MTTTLTADRYLALTDDDTERMLEVAERGLTSAVPSCPGWDVAEVLWHTAMVFEHKARVMATVAWPDPWPEPGLGEGIDEPAFLRDARLHLFEEFARHQPSDQTATFGSDSTVTFWMRRMALEVAVHRFDVESAHRQQTAVPDDLAVDGIDEVLTLFLAGDYADQPTEHPVNAVVVVEAAGRSWVCDVRADEVSVAQADTKPETGVGGAVAGTPSDVFLWLWGRLPDDRVEVTGADTVRAFRARLLECTQ